MAFCSCGSATHSPVASSSTLEAKQAFELNPLANPSLVTRVRFPIMRVCLLPLALCVLIGCQSTSVEDEFADFEPIIRTEDSEEAKAIKMFAGYDPNKKSAFDGKTFEGKEANLRSSIERKEYFEEHPYYKLHQNKTLADKVFDKDKAREGSMIAPWQGEEDSWFKRTFSRKSSNERQKQIARKEAGLSGNGTEWVDKRARYEKEKFPLNIIEEPNKDKQLTRKDLRALLRSQ